MQELGGHMKSTAFKNGSNRFAISIVAICLSLTAYGDIEFDGGVSAEIDYRVDGWVWIYDANVIMLEPAHILGAVVTGSGSVLDVYGGQIDSMLLISTNDLSLPEGTVTVYGTDFAVDGVPVDPNTTELFMQYQTLSGVYENGTPFAFPVDCVIAGGGGYIYYQTVKLGWVVSQPDIELSHDEYDFGQTDIGQTKAGAVTIFNLGDAALTVQSLSLEQGEPLQFDFADSRTLPFTLDPNTAVDIEILYTPVVEGLAEAAVTVFSNDPNNPWVSIELIGQGAPVVLTPEEQIEHILDVYGQAAEDGTLEGVGSRKSATNKVKVFGKMLSVADRLLDLGYDNYTMRVLQMIEAKCDGQKRPKDFIKGPAAEELNTLINELIDTLQQ
jgi:hypothetical protein